MSVRRRSAAACSDKQSEPRRAVAAACVWGTPERQHARATAAHGQQHALKVSGAHRHARVAPRIPGRSAPLSSPAPPPRAKCTSPPVPQPTHPYKRRLQGSAAGAAVPVPLPWQDLGDPRRHVAGRCAGWRPSGWAALAHAPRLTARGRVISRRSQRQPRQLVPQLLALEVCLRDLGAKVNVSGGGGVKGCLFRTFAPGNTLQRGWAADACISIQIRHAWLPHNALSPDNCVPPSPFPRKPPFV